MAQAQYAEGIDWGQSEDPDNNPDGFCKPQPVINQGGGEVGTGYEIMAHTYLWQNDGYSWHNYFVQGREAYQSCQAGGMHVSYYFPDTMKYEMEHGRLGLVTEADLCSPSQCYGRNSLNAKNDNPAATVQSLRNFFAEEPVDIIAAWLLNNDEPNRTEYDWHEGYDEAYGALWAWFHRWWSGSE